MASRPQGLISMSSTTVNGVEKILDFGETVGIGTATHNLTIYRHAERRARLRRRHRAVGVGPRRQPRPRRAAPDQAMQQATINLFADMGAQPGSLQIGADPSRPLVAAAKSSDALAPTSPVTSPADGASVGSGDRVTITGTASDSGGGIVAGVEVSVDGGTTWRGAQGTTSWSFEWSPGALGSVDDSRARDRRQRQPSRAGRQLTVTVVGGRCPCTSLWTAGDRPGRARCRRSEPGRARAEVQERRQRLHQGRPLLQGRGEHRHPHRQPVDEHRLAARPPDFRGRVAVRLAADALRRRRAGHGEHDLRRVVSHQRRPLRRARRLLQQHGHRRARRCMRRPAPPPAATASSCTERRRSRRRRSTRPTIGSTWCSTARRTRPRRQIADVVGDASSTARRRCHLDDGRAGDFERRLFHRGRVPAGDRR